MNTNTIRNASLIAIAIFTLVLSMVGQSSSKKLEVIKSPIVSYQIAKKLIDEGRYSDAKPIVNELLKTYPNDYEIWEFHMRVALRTEGEDISRKIIENSIKVFAETPANRRTSLFYRYYIDSLGYLKRDNEANALLEEATKTFPKSNEFAWLIYSRLASEKNPKQRVEKLSSFVKEYENRHVSSLDASYRILETISDNPQLFHAQALLDAADQMAELLVYQAGPDWTISKESHISYLYGLKTLAKILNARYPEKSLEYAKMGVKYAIAKRDLRRLDLYLGWLKQSILRSHISLKDWDNARGIGEELLELIEKPDAKIEINESEIRRHYALAAENLGLISLARKQLLIASVMNSNFKADLERFQTRHRLPSANLLLLKKQIGSMFSEVMAVRDQRNKKALLRRIVNKKAADFVLKDVNGRQVSLKDFGGKVLILGIWTTWCAPCVREMREIQKAYEKHLNSKNIAFAYVCLDADKTGKNMTAFMKKYGYKFPVYFFDEEMRKGYTVSPIPRLYVIGPKGNIRFEQKGYINDGYFQKRLDWMTEALKPEDSRGH